MSDQPAPHTTSVAPRPRVAVVFGGRSSEHAVSCATAGGVLRAIDRDRWDVVPVGIAKDGRWVLVEDDPEPLGIAPGHLPEVDGSAPGVLVPLATTDRALTVLEPGSPPRELGDVDVVFPLLHGPFGEDGTIQGFLDLSDIRYVGSGVLASAAGMDKHYMKVVFAGSGIPIGPYAVVTDRAWVADRAAVLTALRDDPTLSYPLFVKPARAGSSMGITRVSDESGLEAAIETAREHDPKVVVESGIEGREIECSVLQGHGTDAPRTSQAGEVAVHGAHEFYDFEAKYLDERDVDLRCPADLPEETSAEVRRLAAAAFEALGCEGLARVDCFVTPDGRVLVNEINTMPGFTPFSMYPRMWAASGLAYPDLIDELLTLALERRTGLR